MASNFQFMLRRLAPRNASSWLLLAFCIPYLIGCNGQTATINPPAPVEPPQSNSGWKIGLDPGHGWQGDPGAVGNGLQEKDVTLIIAVLTKSILESNGFQVIMTRTGDDEHDLTQAAKVINEQNPDIVVSIHANSGGSNATGTEACYTVGKSTDTESKALASLLTDSISNKLSLTNRGIFPENSDSRCARRKSTGWNQLYIHDMNPPALIIETAFISNPYDADLLRNRSQDFAQAIADGIVAYFQTRGAITKTPTAIPAPTTTFTPAPSPTPIPTQTPVPLGEAAGRIAFINNNHIYIMRPDGSNLIRLTNSSSDYLSLSWSPDGQKIVFDADDLGDSMAFDVYVMNADGSNRVNLTRSPGMDWFPDWSADGEHIVFVSSRDFSDDYGCYPNCHGEIYVMNADGSNQIRLTNNQADEGVPTWSPDGSRIAFVSNRDDNYEIYVMNADGSNPSRLINNQADDSTPAWSPDGSRIAFVSNRDGNFEIYVMNADGSNQIRLSNTQADESSPSWSPDGTRLVFESRVKNNSGGYNSSIYVMNADGSNLIRLTDGNYSPVWTQR